jgi:hypothetical protein
MSRRPFDGWAGAWADQELLGAAIVAESPVTVRVKVPASLNAVLLWPLELGARVVRHRAFGPPIGFRLWRK